MTLEVTIWSIDIVPRGGPPSTYSPQKGSPPLEFINIQPQKEGPPHEWPRLKRIIYLGTQSAAGAAEIATGTAAVASTATTFPIFAIAFITAYIFFEWYEHIKW